MNEPGQRKRLGILEASLYAALGVAALSGWAAAQEQVHSAADSDIPKAFTAPTAAQDYVKREAMIPMRDGVSCTP